MELSSLFIQIFNKDVKATYIAPARVNLIGEHIDYNGGKVLPCAISCYIKGLVSKREDNQIVTYSTNYSNMFSSPVENIKYIKDNDWSNYVFGVFEILKQEGFKIPFGLNVLLDSNIPLGSGLSSSAALLDLVLYIANDMYNLNINLKTIAKLAQKTENEFCGLKCGIMDQAAIALGKKDKAILLDCNKFEYEYKDISLGEYSFVILKTNTPRNLVDSKYNERVEQCQKALSLIRNKLKVNTLCELEVNQLEKAKQLINNELIYKRVRHVVTENDRVNRFMLALENKDINELGNLLNQSHKSLKEDYEVTGKYLDAIVESALDSGAVGARMTGAGFGGCAIALIRTEEFSKFKENVESLYFKKTKIHPEVFQIDIVDGPTRIN